MNKSLKSAVCILGIVVSCAIIFVLGKWVGALKEPIKVKEIEKVYVYDMTVEELELCVSVFGKTLQDKKEIEELHKQHKKELAEEMFRAEMNAYQQELRLWRDAWQEGYRQGIKDRERGLK